MMVTTKDEQSINMGAKNMNPILTVEEICLWILESYEPEHMSMNYDSTQSHSSMKDNIMKIDNRNNIHRRKGNTYYKTTTLETLLWKIIAWLCKILFTWKCSITKTSLSLMGSNPIYIVKHAFIHQNAPRVDT